MKKMYSTIAVLAISSMVIFSSCSKNDDEAPVATGTPESSIALNENTNTNEDDTLFVNRTKGSALIQVSAVSKTTTDMKRIYVYKKVTTTGSIGSYTTYNGSGFKQDSDNNYYFEIPNDQRNNTALNLTITLTANNAGAVMDEYYFAFTSIANYGGPGTATGLLVGPAQIYVAYGLLTETAGHRLNNIKGPNSGAFDLQTLTNKAASASAAGKDMIDSDSSTANWDKAFFAGTSSTLYVQLASTFDYTNATDVSIAAAYILGTKLGTQLNVANGNMYVAKLRGGNDYALIKVTSILDETGPTGPGQNNEYMEFSVKK